MGMIGPGSIMTDILRGVASDQVAKNRLLSRTPLGRVADPEEVASVAAFLASSDASYLTGETIYVDGGRLALNYTVPVSGSWPTRKRTRADAGGAASARLVHAVRVDLHDAHRTGFERSGAVMRRWVRRVKQPLSRSMNVGAKSYVEIDRKGNRERHRAVATVIYGRAVTMPK
jgi:hypothetical protein